MKVPADILEKVQKSLKSITKYDKHMDISPEMVALGKKLYFDERLSVNNNISCNSCHDLNRLGVDNEPKSMGSTAELGGRNSPSSIYAFLQDKQFWDCRAETVEEQAGGPILNPVEHGFESEEGKQTVVKKVKDIPEYKIMFDKAFSGEENPITFENITTAIGNFERKLYAVSKLDRLLDGNDSGWTQKEVDGLSDFMDIGCASCHGGVAFGGGTAPNGVVATKFGFKYNYEDYTKSEKVDQGMFDQTGLENDKRKFKISSLRNIEQTAPYFHDGSVKDLKEAIRIMGKLQNNKDLNDNQVENIEAFLKTMTADIDSQYKQ